MAGGSVALPRPVPTPSAVFGVESAITRGGDAFGTRNRSAAEAGRDLGKPRDCTEERGCHGER
jgi:hypothetical protein